MTMAVLLREPVAGALASLHQEAHRIASHRSRPHPGIRKTCPVFALTLMLRTSLRNRAAPRFAGLAKKQQAAAARQASRIGRSRISTLAHPPAYCPSPPQSTRPTHCGGPNPRPSISGLPDALRIAGSSLSHSLQIVLGSPWRSKL